MIALHAVLGHDPVRLRSALPTGTSRLGTSGSRSPGCGGVRVRLAYRSACATALDRPGAAEAARAGVEQAYDRLEAELGDNEYLVGDTFTVADLTAAALFYPAVLPPEGPDLPQPTESLMAFRAEQEVRAGFRWVQGVHSRHRGSSP